MNSEELDIEFRDAVARINAHTDPFPADFLLRFMHIIKKRQMIIVDQVVKNQLLMPLKPMHFFS